MTPQRKQYEADYRKKNRVKARQYFRNWYLRNRTEQLSKNRKYYLENREEFRAKQKAWRRANPEKYAHQVFKSKLKHYYGLSFENYQRLLANQMGLCAICTTPMKRPNVDHCHDSKQIRGLLCGSCKRGIGFMKHDPVILKRAIEYLTKNYNP